MDDQNASGGRALPGGQTSSDDPTAPADRGPRPRKRKRRLDRERVARAALALIDREGLDALSMRRVAAELDVDPMLLYRVVRDRAEMVDDIVRLLLDEIDARELPGETWVETMKRMAFSYREMALRHPRAFPLVAHTSTVDEPALTRTRRLVELVTNAGLPQSMLSDVLLMDDAFTTGFLLIETNAICRALDAQARPTSSGLPSVFSPSRDGSDRELAEMMSRMITREAYARGLDILYEGLWAIYLRESKGLHPGAVEPNDPEASSP